MPPQLLVQLLQPQLLPQRRLVLRGRQPVEDRPVVLVLPVLVVKVTRVDLLQPSMQLTRDSPTVAVAAEISGRSGRASG